MTYDPHEQALQALIDLEAALRQMHLIGPPGTDQHSGFDIFERSIGAMYGFVLNNRDLVNYHRSIVDETVVPDDARSLSHDKPIDTN